MVEIKYCSNAINHSCFVQKCSFHQSASFLQLPLKELPLISLFFVNRKGACNMVLLLQNCAKFS